MILLLLRTVLSPVKQRTVLLTRLPLNVTQNRSGSSSAWTWPCQPAQLSQVHRQNRHYRAGVKQFASGPSLGQHARGEDVATVDEAAQDLCKLFKDFDISKSSDEEIAKIQKSLQLNLRKLSYEELVDIVKSIGDDCWPDLLKQESDLSDTFENRIFMDIFKKLQLECNLRLRSRKVEKDKFISLSNENFENVLELCHLWTRVEKKRSKGSFTSAVINHIGDQERGNSTKRFKHFTKDSFVSYCVLMREVNLLKNFHKYYLLVKFVDLFPKMTENDIGAVCATFHYHKINLTSDHPMNMMLKTKLVEYLIENKSTINSQNLSKICLYLATHFPLSLSANFIQFQTSLWETKLMDRHDTRTSLSVIMVTSLTNLHTRNGVSKDFIDSLVARIMKNTNEELCRLSTKEMLALVKVISLHRDTPRGRFVIVSMTKLLIERLTDRPIHNVANILTMALHMAHMGIYSTDLLDQLFKCELVTVPGRGGTGKAMAPRLKYDSSQYSDKGGMDRQGGDLLQLQGMMDLEMTDYKGERITEGLEESLKYVVNYTPLEVREGSEEEEVGQFLTGYHVVRGLELHDILCGLWGQECVWESCVLPFTGQVNYVMRVNKKGKVDIVGEEMRQKDKYEVKHIEKKKDEEWIAFYMIHPDKKRKSMLRTGGEMVTQRILARLGYSGVVINLELWDTLNKEEKMDIIRRKVMKCIGK